ncbi:MAG TPA: enoyl-CoA hydratase-related protein, partial [Cryptosporangiaceae bacterium]|nr:enoyl-CoA hydratase-related protein [Cryptosporangiaceae bacterium]
MTQPAAAQVRYTAASGVATLTLDSPHNRNALSARLMSQLLAGLSRAADDDSVRVVVLTHTGPVFCSGADLKATAEAEDAGGLPVGGIPEVLDAIWRLPKPVVA